MRNKLLRTYCRIQAALVRAKSGPYGLGREDGVEMTEVAGLIAIFVVAAVVAFGLFGGQLSTFINGLPAKLGF